MGRSSKYQFGPLGLVLNAVVLWNTPYPQAALAVMRELDHPVLAADAARLSPLVDAHLNVSRPLHLHPTRVRRPTAAAHRGDAE